MSLRKYLPRGVSEDTFLMLQPIIEAETLSKQQKYVEAEARYLEALNDFPPGSGGRFLIYNKLGILYERTENLDRALEVYREGVEEGSITPFPYHRLAILSLNAGAFGEALNYCDRGVKVLRKAHTGFFQEIYFWCLFKNLKRKIRHSQRSLKG
ncbi:MAG TPA: hypothetical protein DCZ69_05265 [Syntrophobacteraceae bacterium]|jgi:tetratricopeptide (TPR) repeat protein|nr:hypothetical protein [Syntrophobacteraceae bacterium]HBD07649.1 hypothetical protein [Syntrophobacteraceae bacterium]HBZ55513.1 hypothetical protein [Syntrophobacteraceae bacterium]